MARDIKFIQDSDGYWDIDFENGDFKWTEGLDTAMYMSVLGEKRASQSQVKEPILRRGHFTNIFNEIENYQVGSLLWLYIDQSVNSASNATLAKSAIDDGLSWMIDDSILLDVETQIVRNGTLMTINIELISSLDSQSNYYDLFINTVN